MIVADALRYDMFIRRFRRKDGFLKRVFASGPNTPSGVTALLYGITPSSLQLPLSLSSFSIEQWYGMLRGLREVSLPGTLSRKGIFTVSVILNDFVPHTSTDLEIRPCKSTISGIYFRQIKKLLKSERVYLLQPLYVLLTQNPLFASIDDLINSMRILADRLSKGRLKSCVYVHHIHTPVVKRKIFDIVDKYRNKKGIFIYIHLLTPHEPYFCSSLNLLSHVEKIYYTLLYLYFHRAYLAKVFKGLHFDSVPEMVESLDRYFRNSDVFEREIYYNIATLKAKDAYKECVKRVVDFLEEVITKYGDDWNIVFTSDHPEYFGDGGATQHTLPPALGKMLYVPLYIRPIVEVEIPSEETIFQTSVPEIIARFFKVRWTPLVKSKVYEHLIWEPHSILFHTGSYAALYTAGRIIKEWGDPSQRRLVSLRLKEALRARAILGLRSKTISRTIA